MCTVTYIPQTRSGGFILTSNRDERMERKTIAPRVFDIAGRKVCFPMDSQAGGSWIAASNDGKLCCLLNGGNEPHQKQEHHIYSRGKVLLDFIATEENTREFFMDLELGNVEPFTIITIRHEEGSVVHFSESLWDGENKHFRDLDEQHPHIWSSVTLYTPEQRMLRKEWFQKFISEFFPGIEPDHVMRFHSGTHTGDRSVNVVMEREGGLKTVSITQIIPGAERQLVKYLDFVEDRKYELEL